MDLIHKLFATGSATADGVATTDVTENGRITGIWGYLDVTNADAATDGYAMEISFASSSGFTSNDTRSSIYGCSVRCSLTTSGGYNSSQAFASPPLNIEVVMGERIYAHILEDGAPASYDLSVWIAIAKAAVARRRPSVRTRRRRQ